MPTIYANEHPPRAGLEIIVRRRWVELLITKTAVMPTKQLRVEDPAHPTTMASSPSVEEIMERCPDTEGGDNVVVGCEMLQRLV